MKIVKVLVDDRRVLAGFVMSGKDSDFGGMTNAEVLRNIPLTAMTNSKFRNRQIRIERSSIVEQGSFRLNKMPMAKIVGNQIVDVDNHVTILERFEKDNANVGFKVRFGDGEEANITYSALLKFARWFDPTNFVVKTSRDGKTFIAGKPGAMRLEDLKVNYIGEPVDTGKRTKSGARKKENIAKAASTQVGSGVDILDIYDWVIANKGAYLNLPSTKYVPKTVDKEPGETGETEEGKLKFIPLPVSEICQSPLEFNPVNLKVNAAFKKAGTVNVPNGNTSITIVTYIDRKKSIFVGGKEYIKKFGVAIPADKEAELIRIFGTSMAFKEIKDDAITRPLNSVISSSGLKFYEVTTSNIDLIAKDKIPTNVLEANEIYDLILAMNDCQVISKCFSTRGKYMKNLKKDIGDEEVADVMKREPFGVFSVMSAEDRKRMTELGFNIYTGSFNYDEGYSKKSKSTAEEAEETCIAYGISGKTIDKETGESLMKMAIDGDLTKMSKNIAAEIVAVLSITDPKERYKTGLEVAKKYSARNDALKQKLWRHEVCMLALGNNRDIHTRDYYRWEFDEKATSRMKAAKVYRHTKIDGLFVKFTGVHFATNRTV